MLWLLSSRWSGIEHDCLAYFPQAYLWSTNLGAVVQVRQPQGKAHFQAIKKTKRPFEHSPPPGAVISRVGTVPSSLFGEIALLFALFPLLFFLVILSSVDVLVYIFCLSLCRYYL